MRGLRRIRLDAQERRGGARARDGEPGERHGEAEADGLDVRLFSRPKRIEAFAMLLRGAREERGALGRREGERGEARDVDAVTHVLHVDADLRAAREREQRDFARVRDVEPQIRIRGRGERGLLVLAVREREAAWILREVAPEERAQRAARHGVFASIAVEVEAIGLHALLVRKERAMRLDLPRAETERRAPDMRALCIERGMREGRGPARHASDGRHGYSRSRNASGSIPKRRTHRCTCCRALPMPRATSLTLPRVSARRSMSSRRSASSRSAFRGEASDIGAAASTTAGGGIARAHAR